MSFTTNQSLCCVSVILSPPRHWHQALCPRIFLERALQPSLGSAQPPAARRIPADVTNSEGPTPPSSRTAIPSLNSFSPPPYPDVSPFLSLTALTQFVFGADLRFVAPTRNELQERGGSLGQAPFPQSSDKAWHTGTP